MNTKKKRKEIAEDYGAASRFDPEGWYTGVNAFDDDSDPVQDADDL